LDNKVIDVLRNQQIVDIFIIVMQILSGTLPHGLRTS